MINKLQQKNISFADIKKSLRKYAYDLINKTKSNHFCVTTFSKSETTKFCKKCKQDLPVSMFYLLRDRKNNIESLSHNCKTCQSQYYKEKRNDVNYLNNNRKKLLEYYHERKKKDPIFGKFNYEKHKEHLQYLKNNHSILEWMQK